jgi:HK97 family phage major capsid protein
MILQIADEVNVRSDVASGNFSKLTDYVKKELNKSPNRRESNFVAGLIDTASLNPVWADKFSREFNKVMGSKISIQNFSEEEKEDMKSYTITGGVSGTNISGLFETTILPVIDGLLFDNSPILSRVSQIPVGANDGNQSFKLNEFGAEKDAEDLDEDDAGTEADEAIRSGDTLLPDNKIQASTSFTEYALLTMSPELFARFLSRLLKRIQNRYVYNIIAGSDASNQFKGIINTAGSTEDDQEGALAYTYAGSGATDNLDYVLRSLGDLPDAVTEGEESRFCFIMKRSDFYQKIAVVQDLNQNYKRTSAIIDMPGERSIGGVPVLFAGYGLSTKQVILADLSNCYVAKKGGLRLISDDGLANVKSGNVTIVAKEYADGGMTLAHKNAVGAGAGANNNQQRNLFRLLTLN